MSGTADPHEPPALPSLLGRTTRTPHTYLTDGPTRIYDSEFADPTYEIPRIRGFAPRRVEPVEPLLWDGDQA